MQEPGTILPTTDDVVPGPRWPNGPAPFLSQPRAVSALRHEFDALATKLSPMLDRQRADTPERTFELHVLPNRLIARMADVAVSFSWLAGRTSSVDEGRLLVIAWRGVESELKGMPALRSATPMQESTYRAEGAAPESWRWDLEDATGTACTSAALVDEWVGRASTLSVL